MLEYWMIKYGIKDSYSFAEFIELIMLSKVIDARKGGFINGRSHLEGNIYLFHFDGTDFKINGSVQGGEYIVNTQASALYKQRLEQINRDRPTDINLLTYPKMEFNLSITDATNIINTHSEPDMPEYTQIYPHPNIPGACYTQTYPPEYIP
jgi:hypothetical protein